MLLRFFSSALLLVGTANASCYTEAAQRYLVPEELIRAIAMVESGSADAATVENTNTNGTKDIGRMQINTTWLPTLASYGITEARLREECTSIMGGTWILSNNIARLGWSWDAVGAYNVGCKALDPIECERRRVRYALKVRAALHKAAKLPVSKRESEPPSASTIARIATVVFQ